MGERAGDEGKARAQGEHRLRRESLLHVELQSEDGRRWRGARQRVVSHELPISKINSDAYTLYLHRYAEESQHQYGKEPTTLKTGHFTQVVWRDSTELGVGMARNRNGEVYVVANYNPPGNFLGSFSENVQPPQDSSSTSSSPQPGKSSPDSVPKIMDERAWQDEALQVHNEYRRRHRVPELRLSADLSSAAKVNVVCVRSFV